MDVMMAPDVVSGSKNNIKKPSGSRNNVLKKGPWTGNEDAILMKYVKTHGEGNWNAVQRNSGLMRCGKSCRLRWANHLRPNLKKGSFSAEEEALIIDIHSKLGNKWARISAQLPGRTDNEIKNYWNTRLKRRQRAGLPIYPNEVNRSSNKNQVQESAQASLLSSSLLSSSMISSSIISSQPQPKKPRYNMFDICPSNAPGQSYNNSSNHNNTFNQFYSFIKNNIPHVSNPSFPLYHSLPCNKNAQLPSFSPFGSSVSSVQSNHFNFSCDPTTELELPSIQPFSQQTTPTSSENGGIDTTTTSNNPNDIHDLNDGFYRGGDSGGLEDMFKEKPKERKLEMDLNNQKSYLWDYLLMEDSVTITPKSATEQSFLSYGQNNFVQQKHSQQSSPDHSSLGKITANALSDQSIQAVDYIFNNEWNDAPIIDWNHTSNGQEEPGFDIEII